jgi:hypothetical protein
MIEPLLLLWPLLSSASASPPASRVTTASLYVNAASGSDSNNGSFRRPFQTIGRCTSVAASIIGGCRCLVAPGTYRETVNLRGSRTHNIQGIGPGVIISGCDMLDSPQWSPWHGHIYRTTLPGRLLDAMQQLFVDGEMMHEARWPNVRTQSDLFNHTKAWRPTGVGSRYGTVVNADIATQNFSWQGALATLNVAHQFWTWTRTISNHTRGNNTLHYSKNLGGLLGFDKPAHKLAWEHNQFFLSGKLEALDAEREWFATDGFLYLWAPRGANPTSLKVEVKVRDYAFEMNSHVVSAVTLRNMELFAATVGLRRCQYCSLSNLRLRFPTHNRRVREFDSPRGQTISTLINGSHNIVSNFTLSDTNNHGLQFQGQNNTLNNALIENVDSLGTLLYGPLIIKAGDSEVFDAGGDQHPNRVLYTTVRRFGNAGVQTYGATEVAYSHILQGGTIGKDTSALYTSYWSSAGTRWHHNWVHSHFEKCLRADDQSRNVSVFNNVIFNCGTGSYRDWDPPPLQPQWRGYGMIMKGDGHTLNANTMWAAGEAELCVPSCPEPYKPQNHFTRDMHQNSHTYITNNAAHVTKGECSCGCEWNKSETCPPGGAERGNYDGFELGLENMFQFQFRPTSTSPLIGRGINGSDVGAYQHDGEYWIPGCLGLGLACVRM